MARNPNRKSKHFPPPASIAKKVQSPKRWEKWEEELYLSLRAEGKSNKQISQHLPGRTANACKIRATGELRNQTLPNHRRRWEDWEDQLLLAHHKAGCSYSTISELLSHRTRPALSGRFNAIRKSRPETTTADPTAARSQRHWTSEEDRLLKSLRRSGQSWTDIAKQFPDCTVTQCISHLNQLVHPPRSKGWKEWEERLLVSGYYAGRTWEEIVKSIPGRTKTSASRQWSLHFRLPRQDKPWTSEELSILTHLRAEGSGWEKISQKVPGRSSNACRIKWYKGPEGTRGCSQRYFWSAEETDTLVALYNTIGPRWDEICKHIPGRTAMGCFSHLYKKCTREDGVGGVPSEYWKNYFKGKQSHHPGSEF